MYVSDEEILKTVNRDIKSINGRLADMAEQRGCKII
jgi:hypothetical protein